MHFRSKSLKQILALMQLPTPKGGKKIYYESSSDLFDYIKLIKSWEDILGSKYAKRCLPRFLKNGTLYIVCAHGQMSMQMTYLEEALLQKIHEKLPRLKRHVTKLRFQARPHEFQEILKDFENKKEASLREEEREKHKKDPKPKFFIHPRSPLYRRLKAEAEVMYSDVEDEKMRGLLESIYIQRMSQEDAKK